MDPTDDAIIENLKNKNFEFVKHFIRKLEDKLNHESIKYNKTKLRERIYRIKELYRKYEMIPSVEFTLKKNKEKSFEEIFMESNDSIVIANKCDCEITIGDCKTCVIENCQHVKVPYFSAKQSIFIRNVSDSHIECSSEQLRLSGCKNLYLKIFTATGVFIENSKEIKIEGIYNKREINNYNKVYDLSDPGSNKNYKIIN
ncbi:hypothetical protein TCON_0269 [Astathelohania contejeani]|uniref:C-CAP/cofactor C-like domain-containing protein n=1 Tax=Astathelohania contejeani TaxID=164912 RepID=A0ABQ7I271_9MICR|nr:hypothetical protein TCON_0269 [Thelohania contejeani]